MSSWMNAAAIAACLSASFAFAGDHKHWSYEGDHGPAHWGSLHSDFSVCATGKNQSPIDLVRAVEGELAPITINYKAGGTTVLNNGHTVQINYAEGSEIVVEGHSYALKQFHFHTPSENTIAGQSFPLEGHFVHADADGNLAVIGVMFELGAENQELAKAWKYLPLKAGTDAAIADVMNADALLPANRDYFRFNGSLTTPPCSEGVVWMVMKQPLTLSEHQQHQFAELMGHANNRPVQPINARVIVQ